MQRAEIRDLVRLATLLETQNVTDAQLNTLINQALHELEVYTDWKFLEESVDIAVTLATQTSALPVGFLRGMMIVDKDEDTPLSYLPTHEFLELFGNNDDARQSTRITLWTVWDADILWWPIPSATDADRYSLYYYKAITELSNDTTEVEFAEGFHYLIVEYLKWKLWEREEYFEQAEAARLMWWKGLEDMVKYYSRITRLDSLVWGDGSGWRRRWRQGDPNIPSLYWI